MRSVKVTALAATVLYCYAAHPAAHAEPTYPLPELAQAAATTFVADPDLVDARPAVVDSWSRLPDPASIRLYFTGGVPDCFGVHALTRETPESVTVELRSGTPPAAVGRACILLALTGQLDVPLSGPLGDRPVLGVA